MRKQLQCPGKLPSPLFLSSRQKVCLIIFLKEQAQERCALDSSYPAGTTFCNMIQQSSKWVINTHLIKQIFTFKIYSGAFTTHLQIMKNFFFYPTLPFIISLLPLYERKVCLSVVLYITMTTPGYKILWVLHEEIIQIVIVSQISFN